MLKRSEQLMYERGRKDGQLEGMRYALQIVAIQAARRKLRSFRKDDETCIRAQTDVDALYSLNLELGRAETPAEVRTLLDSVRGWVPHGRGDG